MRIEAAEITPEGVVTEISGPNEAGKSSSLRAFVCALAGKDAIPEDPVRHGAEQAEIEVELDELRIRLLIDPDRKTKLLVTNADGFKATSPQKLLDGLYSKFPDPVAISRLTAKQQRELVADLAGLSDMLDTLWRADESDKLKRRDVNRDLNALKARIDAMPEVAPVDPVDVSIALGELRAAGDHNKAVGRAQLDRTAREQQIAANYAEAERLREEALRLIERAEALESTAAFASDELKKAPAIAAMIDTAPIEQRIAEADATNAQHRAFTERTALVAQAAELDAMSTAYTEGLEQREAERRAVIEAADLPIEGLGFGDDCLTYNGVRFDQASTGVTTRVCTAIAMAMSPRIRVILVKDWSLLDSKNRRIVTEMAESRGYKVLAEVVDESGDVGVYIEDGRVAAINGVPVQAVAA